MEQLSKKGVKWTVIEEERMINLSQQGLNDAEIGKALGRSERAIVLRREKIASNSPKQKIYVIACKDNKYYVGQTSRDVDTRVLEHFARRGSAWTYCHPPMSIIETFDADDKMSEDIYTKKYMKKYGIDNVRGGSYCRVTLPKFQLQALHQEFHTIDNTCFDCGSSDHYVKDCPNRVCYHCKEPGHYANVCPLKTPTTDPIPASEEVKCTWLESLVNFFLNDGKCAACGRFGHMAERCGYGEI
jgi:predicted GIY-YIG superfamily endonuclease